MDQQVFLYRIHPTRTEMLSQGPGKEEEEINRDHFDYLKGLCGEGVVIHAGRTLVTDRESFGIVILRAGSEEEAREVMEEDPAVKKGVMAARLFPYRIALEEKER